MAKEFVAECMWPGVRERDLHALDKRTVAEARRISATGPPVRYLGSLLMREDEVVLCMFEGELDGIRATATAAGIPYDRLLESGRSPWQASE